MCTVQHIKEASLESYQSQQNMESGDVDRSLQGLPFSSQWMLNGWPRWKKELAREKKGTRKSRNRVIGVRLFLYGRRRKGGEVDGCLSR